MWAERAINDKAGLNDNLSCYLGGCYVSVKQDYL